MFNCLIWSSGHELELTKSKLRNGILRPFCHRLLKRRLCFVKFLLPRGCALADQSLPENCQENIVPRFFSPTFARRLNRLWHVTVQQPLLCPRQKGNSGAGRKFTSQLQVLPGIVGLVQKGKKDSSPVMQARRIRQMPEPQINEPDPQIVRFMIHTRIGQKEIELFILGIERHSPLKSLERLLGLRCANLRLGQQVVCAGRCVPRAQDGVQYRDCRLILTGGNVTEGQVEVRGESIRDVALRCQKMGNRVVEPALPRESYSLAELGFGLPVIALCGLRLRSRDSDRRLRLRERNGGEQERRINQRVDGSNISASWRHDSIPWLGMIIATTRTRKLPLVPRARNSSPGLEEAESLSSALSAVLAEGFPSEADVFPQGLTSQGTRPVPPKNAFAIPRASNGHATSRVR